MGTGRNKANMSNWSDSASNDSTRRYRDNDKYFSGVGHYEWEKSDDGWKERNTERTKSVAASMEWWDKAVPCEYESQQDEWWPTLAIEDASKKRRTGNNDGASSSMGPCGSSGIDGTQSPDASAAPDASTDSWEAVESPDVVTQARESLLNNRMLSKKGARAKNSKQQLKSL